MRVTKGKRFLGVVSALVLGFSMLPQVSRPVEAADNYPLVIAGVSVTSDNLVIDPTDTPSVKSGSASYDNGTKTLTLNNFVCEGTEYDNAPINAEIEGLRIIIKGTNSIKCNTTNQSFCIANWESNVYFDGDGTLDIKTAETEFFNHGIYSKKNINISNCTISITTGTGSETYGIWSESNITVNNGAKLTVKAGYAKTSSYGIQGAVVDIKEGAAVVALGETKAINAKVVNAEKGNGWTDVKGTSGKTSIEASGSGQELTFKRVHFPDTLPDPEPEPEPGPSRKASTTDPWNIFYTTYYGQPSMKINLPEGAKPSMGSGNWTEYFNITEDGIVTVKPTDKKTRRHAASAAKGTIYIPITDAVGNQIGRYDLKLPVTYSEPKIELSQSKGTIRKDDGFNEIQTLSTIVRTKLDGKNYEALDLSTQKKDIALFTLTKGNATAVIAEGPDALKGQINISASDKASGKINIQLDNWSGPIELRYVVNRERTDVITASVDGGEYLESSQRVVLNNNAPAPGTDHVVKFRINGKPADLSQMEISYKESKAEKGAFITEAKGDTFTVKYPEDPRSMERGRVDYTFKSAGRGKLTFSVDVRKNDLSKSVTLARSGKLDLVAGSKLAFSVKKQHISGNVDAVSVSDENFTVSYDRETNKIYLSVAPGVTLPVKKYKPTINVTVGGVVCPVTVSEFKPTTTKPTVKVGSIRFPENAYKNGTAEGLSSLNATIKVSGVTYSVTPSEVVFREGTMVEGPGPDGESGWYLIKKAHVYAKYVPEKGGIIVKATGTDATKVYPVKLSLYFNGYGKKIDATIAMSLL